MLDDFRLRVFEAVAEENSFTRAAVRLGVSQSAVSQSVAELEKTLGVKLFVRMKGQVPLTAEGRAFSGYARNILHWYESAALAFGGLVSESPVVLYSTSDLACPLLADAISPIVSGGGMSRIDLLVSDTGTAASVENPEAWCLEAFSRSGEGTIPLDGEEYVGDSPLCAVVSPSDTRAYTHAGALSSLEDPRFAIWSGLCPAGEEGRILGIDNAPRVCLRSMSVGAVMSAVTSSSLVGILPLYSVYKELADRTLVRLPVSLPLQGSMSVYLRPSASFRRSPLYMMIRQRIMEILSCRI